MDFSKFNDIRPYTNEQVRPAIERIASNPLLSNIAAYLFPHRSVDYLKQILLSCYTIDDFQKNVMQAVVSFILQKTSTGLTSSGLEHFNGNKKYLIISNHRDIVLDSAIIQVLLYRSNIQTSEIAVGDNLITTSFIEDITRSNKMIKVIRNNSPRELYISSQKLSQYIRLNVANQLSSVWIAQRNGRTKDGWDATEQGLLKMFDMSGTGDFKNDFNDLSILPTSISYEYEPCDSLKAIELYCSRRAKYVKAENEDLNSILTGITQQKGGIHIEFNNPIKYEEIALADKLDKNDKFKFLANLIDERIVSNFKLWNNNFIAYDLLKGGDKFSSYYSKDEKRAFEEYMSSKLSNSEYYGDELIEIFLSIYANPIINKKMDAI